MTLTFEINGNQEAAAGNPIPYVRSTQRQFWKANVRRYEAWKRYVVATYLKDVATAGSTPIRLGWGKTSKPIDLDGRKAYMHIMITWRNHHHGDPDNVWKGIADALFKNDKLVAGSFDYLYGDAGMVQIQILIDENNE